MIALLSDPFAAAGLGCLLLAIVAGLYLLAAEPEAVRLELARDERYRARLQERLERQPENRAWQLRALEAELARLVSGCNCPRGMRYHALNCRIFPGEEQA